MRHNWLDDDYDPYEGMPAWRIRAIMRSYLELANGRFRDGDEAAAREWFDLAMAASDCLGPELVTTAEVA